MSKATTIQAAAPRPASSRTPVRRAARGVWLGQWNSAVTSYYLLAGATVLLLVLGLVMVLSSSSVDSLQDGDSAYSVFLNQAKFALMGLPFMLVAMRLRPSFYKKMAWPALFLAMGLQLLIFTPMARGEKGNTNWVYLGGGITIQPSELAKVALAVWLGVVLGRKMALLGEWKHAFVPVIPVAMVVIALVLAGKDLGTAMVLMLIVAGALFVAGLPLRMFAIAGAGVIAAVAVLVVGSDNRMNRIAATFGGQCDEAGACYQVVRGLEGLAQAASWGWASEQVSRSGRTCQKPTTTSSSPSSARSSVCWERCSSWRSSRSSAWRCSASCAATPIRWSRSRPLRSRAGSSVRRSSTSGSSSASSRSSESPCRWCPREGRRWSRPCLLSESSYPSHGTNRALVRRSRLGPTSFAAPSP